MPDVESRERKRENQFRCQIQIEWHDDSISYSQLNRDDYTFSELSNLWTCISFVLLVVFLSNNSVSMDRLLDWFQMRVELCIFVFAFFYSLCFDLIFVCLFLFQRRRKNWTQKNTWNCLTRQAVVRLRRIHFDRFSLSHAHQDREKKKRDSEWIQRQWSVVVKWK